MKCVHNHEEVYLHFRNGMNTVEIGQHMKIPEYTAERLLHYAKQHRPEYDDWGRDKRLSK